MAGSAGIDPEGPPAVIAGPAPFWWFTAATKAETVVTVELTPAEGHGTNLRLRHEGFPDEDACVQHREAWPDVLAQQDQAIT